MRFLMVLLLSAGLAKAESDKAGEFDYYVMALSWSPTWCALEGDRRGSPQCEDDADFGWVLHGLWPQFERGWPSNCPTSHRNPSRADTRNEADLYGSSGSAWHQWNKHGRCSGLAADDFYALSREAYSRIMRPALLRKLEDPIRLPASVIEQAFLEANPGLNADQITITCKADRIQEARICLTRDLELRSCGSDVSRDCRMSDALLDPIR
jgi:ribonuclease T2